MEWEAWVVWEAWVECQALLVPWVVCLVPEASPVLVPLLPRRERNQGLKAALALVQLRLSLMHLPE